MAFAQASSGNTHKTCLFLEVGNRFAANVAHGSSQTAGKLMQYAAKGALVRHLAFNPLRNELEAVGYFCLEVAVGRAARHGSNGSHTTIGFVGTSLVQIDIAWAFLGASQQ